jgi:hypothetical protein
MPILISQTEIIYRNHEKNNDSNKKTAIRAGENSQQQTNKQTNKKKTKKKRNSHANIQNKSPGDCVGNAIYFTVRGRQTSVRL